MHWLMVGLGLMMVGILVKMAQPPNRMEWTPKAELSAALTDHLKSAAHQSQAQGRTRMSIQRGLLRALEQPLGRLCGLSAEELLPASRRLCEKARFLQEETAQALSSVKALPALPASAERTPRVRLFARELFEHSVARLTERRLAAAIRTWQQECPLTTDEWRALPEALRLCLVEQACALSQVCADDQHARQCAHQADALRRQGRMRGAEKLFARFQHHPAFIERMLCLDKTNEWLHSDLSQQESTAEGFVAREHARQAENALWAENIIASLYTLAKLDWDRLQEELSLLHAALMADAVYAVMDRPSQQAYRHCISRIARQTRLTEQRVCQSALTLCQGREPESVRAHIGYYLLDEGRQELLALLQGANPAVRIRLFILRHSFRLLCAACGLLAALLTLAAWRMHLWPAVWLPFVVVFLCAFLEAAFAIHPFEKRVPFAPCIQLDHLTPDIRTLAVCPVVLTSAEEAVAAVKHLSVMYEANPEEHLHFLLLGDFQDSLSGTLSTDNEIMAAASAAAEALCEDTGHPFFYIQRSRTAAPGEQLHHGRGRKYGALEALLRLLQGESAEDAFHCATVDPAQLKGVYRYVLVLDHDTLLPPGSVLHMAGAMLHPLTARQQDGSRLRGAGLLQPRMKTALHSLQTRLSVWADGAEPFEAFTCFQGVGLLDPAAYLQAVGNQLPVNAVPCPDLLAGGLAGCRYAAHLSLYRTPPQTVHAFLQRWHLRVCSSWQMLPFLLPLPHAAYRAHRSAISRAERFQIAYQLLQSLSPIFQLVLLGYACAASRGWLALGALLLPAAAEGFASWRTGWRGFFFRLAVLPSKACTAADAAARSLYRLLISHRRFLQPPFLVHTAPAPLLWAMQGACAAALAVLSLEKGVCQLLGFAAAALWLGFALARPWLEQERRPNRLPTRYMREVLSHLARRTLTFFETAITEEDHALPPISVQIDPNKGIAHRTSPEAIGWYLCALAAAEKLHLLPPQEAALRMSAAVSTLEKLDKWHGLPYCLYDSRSLLPLEQTISFQECGLLAVCLLTCAQGIRTMLSRLHPSAAALASRMDALAKAMQLHRLYDADAALFYTSWDVSADKPSARHHTLLSSPARLGSFVALMLGQVPLAHWQRLGRSQAKQHALLSPSGAMADYLVPLMFQPSIPGTLLDSSIRASVHLQQRHRLSRAFGVSDSSYFAFDPELNFLSAPFGLPALALHTGIQSDVLAPYATLLAMMQAPKKAFRNLLRLQVLGLEGPLGLFEAADFSAARTLGEAMRVVRSHTAQHQGMILCAICNVLEKNHLSQLFASLPRAQAFQLLLEEAPHQRRSAIRRPLRRLPDRPAPQQMQRAGRTLCLPVDAHLLGGAGTSWMITAQGSGFLRRNGIALTRFQVGSQPSGIRLYLRDSQSGAFWDLADPTLASDIRFETAQAVFQQAHLDVACEMRLWVDPLSGAAIHSVALENQQKSERLMEICSYLEPSLSPVDQPALHAVMHTERMDRFGVAAAAADSSARLWHLLATDAPIHLLRIQCDRAAFQGRGRSLHAPRALEAPIGAVPDLVGEQADPCLSIRAQFLLPPGGKTLFCFTTHMPSKHETSASFCERFGNPASVLQSDQTARTRAEVVGRYLSLTVDEQAAVSWLTGALFWTCQPPVLLVRCHGSIQPELTALLIKAHAFFHMNAAPIELLFAVESHSKSALLCQQLEEHIEAGQDRELGGVRVLVASDEEMRQLCSQACLVLNGNEPLSDQLERMAQSLDASVRYSSRIPDQWKAALPDGAALMLDNGWSGFTQPEGNVQISLPPGRHTPAPWRLPLCSEAFSTMTSDSGLGASFAKGAALTQAMEDSVCPLCAEGFYLRDEEHRLLWCLTRQPMSRSLPMRITYAPGEVNYECSAVGVEADIQCFTDVKSHAGVRIVRLKNESDKPRTLSLLHACRFLDGSLCASIEADHIRMSIPSLDEPACLCAVDPPACSCAVMTAHVFDGLWGEVPHALAAFETLPQENGNVAVLRFDMVLAPGESRMFATALTGTLSDASAASFLEEMRRDGAGCRLHHTRQFWEAHLGRLQFDLPDPALSLLMGRWLPYQAQAALWMQASASLPALLSMTPLHPEQVRGHFLALASQPMASSGNLLGFLFAAACFLENSLGDRLLSKPLAWPEEAQTDPLLLSCLRLLADIPLGPHRMPLTETEEESVRQGMMLCDILRRFAAWCPPEDAQWMMNQRALLLDTLERYAWDGSWYLHGFAKAGEAPLHLLEQSWAVLCGLSRDRSAIALENAWRFLYESGAGVMKLTTHPESVDQHSWVACLAMAALHQQGEDRRAWELMGALMPTTHTATRQLAARYHAEPYAMAARVHAHPQLRGRGVCTWDGASAGSFLTAVLTQLLGFQKKGDSLRLRPTVPAHWDAIRITYHYGASTYHLHASRDHALATADGETLPDGALCLVDDGRIHEAFFPLR